MAQAPRDRMPIEPQSVDAPLSRAAVFLLAVTLMPTDAAMAHARSVIADLDGHVSCNVALAPPPGPRRWNDWYEKNRSLNGGDGSLTRGRAAPPGHLDGWTQELGTRSPCARRRQRQWRR
jgi:hypothetical protein